MWTTGTSYLNHPTTSDYNHNGKYISAPTEFATVLLDKNDEQKLTTMNDVAPAVPWYTIPIGNKATTRMTKSVWLYISLGAVFVTYILPTPCSKHR